MPQFELLTAPECLLQAGDLVKQRAMGRAKIMLMLADTNRYRAFTGEFNQPLGKSEAPDK